MRNRGEKVLRWGSLALAIAVGVFHGALRPLPGKGDVAEVEKQVRQVQMWQGRIAPEVESPLLDGGTFRLADHIGKQVILLNFFATWCPPCRAEIPELRRYLALHAGEGLMVVGIDSGETEALVRPFLRDNSVSYPVGLDPEDALKDTFGVQSFPTSILIGRDGRIELYETGAILNADVALGPAFGAARAAPAVTVADWHAALAKAPPLPNWVDRGAVRLTGRSKEIAAQMGCPCGCTDTVVHCDCQTSANIKKRLASMSLAGKSDAEVMTELNRLYCPGASHAHAGGR